MLKSVVTHSGNVLSGGLGRVHLASGTLLVGSGDIASGSVEGFFGVRHIASGTVGVDDLGSGAVVAGSVGSGAVRSGNIASGQVGLNHISSGAVRSGHIASGQIFSPKFSSGAVVPISRSVAPYTSGWSIEIASQGVQASEMISGVRAVTVDPSNNQFRIAMASVSGRMPAVGIVWDNFSSGDFIREVVSTEFKFTNIDLVRPLVGPVYVGRSGEIVSLSGSWNSGGFLSGDIIQPLGVCFYNGSVPAPLLWVDVGPPYLSGGPPVLQSGAVGSGAIASGAVQGFYGTTRQIASGTVGSVDLASGAVETGALGSGAVQSGNIASGSIGRYHIASGRLDGFELGSGAIVSGRVASGQLGVYHLQSGLVTSGLHLSGSIGSGQIGHDHLSSGGVRSGTIASGNVWGLVGSLPHVASGSFTGFELGSGAVVSGRIASGQVGFGHLANGSVRSGTIASGSIFTDHFANDSAIDRAVALILVSGKHTYTTEENIQSGQVPLAMSQSGTLRMAMASVSGRMPAIGYIVLGANSGTVVNLITHSVEAVTGFNFSGSYGQPVYVGRSGFLVTASGSWNSGGFQSGDVIQPFGVADGGGNLVSIIPSPFSAVAGEGVSFSLENGSVRFYVGSGAIQSGQIASGSVSRFKLSSGAANSGHIGSGAIIGAFISGLSQSIASGTIGPADMASGTIFAGVGIGVAVNLSGIAISNLSGGAAANLASGAVQSGHLASGSVPGYFGPTRVIQSGTVGYYDFGSGLAPQLLTAFQSGWQQTILTEEGISGVRAVAISQSGNLRIAMASVSGRMPAVGIVVGNVASGIQADVYTDGVHQLSSGMANWSGQLGLSLVVGRSGHVVRVSGSWASGGFLSGDVVQKIGVVRNSGALVVRIDPTSIRRASG